MRVHSGNAKPQLGSILYKAKLGLGVPREARVIVGTNQRVSGPSLSF